MHSLTVLCRYCAYCFIWMMASLSMWTELCNTLLLIYALYMTSPNCPQNCRVCKRCGVRSSGQWANHLSLCESCDPGLPCPLCDQASDPSSMQNHLTCCTCYRYSHSQHTAMLAYKPKRTKYLHLLRNIRNSLHMYI